MLDHSIDPSLMGCVDQWERVGSTCEIPKKLTLKGPFSTEFAAYRNSDGGRKTAAKGTSCYFGLLVYKRETIWNELCCQVCHNIACKFHRNGKTFD